MNLRERMEREERRRQVQSNVALYQVLAVCWVIGLGAIVVAVWAVARVL